MFPNDFKELLSAFNNRKIKYLVIGGYAVVLHSQPRATKDMDLLIRPDPANAEAVYAALAEFGAPLDGLKPMDLIEPGTFFRMGYPPLMVDILPFIKGIDFDSAWEERADIEIDPNSGLRASVISVGDLIKSEIASGRPIDLIDVTALRLVHFQSPQQQTRDLPGQERLSIVRPRLARESLSKSKSTALYKQHCTSALSVGSVSTDALSHGTRLKIDACLLRYTFDCCKENTFS